MHTKITAEVFIEIPDAADPEEVVGDFNRGLLAAVEGFPDAEVHAARVLKADDPTQEELDTYFPA